MQDCYEILESKKTDSIEDIKTNYRKLVLRFHPDKNEGNTEKFIQIDKAYKRILKHRSVTVSLNDRARRFMLLMYLFMKPKNIKLDIKISIEDIYNAEVKKINYRRFYNGEKVRHTVYIDLLNFRNEYTFEELGDENPITKKCGDLIVYITIDYGEYDKTLFVNDVLCVNKISDNYGLSYKVKINLYEYFYGLKNNYDFINSILNLSHHIPHENGMYLTVKNKGLPYESDDTSDYELHRGDLTIMIELNLDNVKKESKDIYFHNFLKEHFN